MKKLIIIICLLINPMFNYSISRGQINRDPAFYLNGKPFDLQKTFLNPRRIDLVNLDKDSMYGEILVFTRSRNFTFYTLSDILKKYTTLNEFNSTVLYRINGKMIEDTTSIEIDDTYFVYVNIEQLSRVKYISNKFNDLWIVNIDLETDKRKPKILIRGDSD
jgi:hypothetical protein